MLPYVALGVREANHVSALTRLDRRTRRWLQRRQRVVYSCGSFQHDQIGPDDRAARDDHRTLDDVLKLTHIPRPVVRDELLAHTVLQLRERGVLLLGEAPKEVGDK